MAMTAEEEENRRIAAAFWAANAAGDRESFLSLLTDDCVYRVGVGKSERVVPYHGTFVGKSHISRYVEKIRAESVRPYCRRLPEGPGEPGAPIDQPDGLIVQGNTVVGFGHVRDEFRNGGLIHECEFALLMRVDPQQKKVCYVHFFIDTAATMLAWLHKG